MLEWIISASVLIIMVIVSRKLLRGKISCWVQYSLWLLVAVRLLVPISPMESALSVANLLPENWTGQISGGSGTGAALGTEPGQGMIYQQEQTPEASTSEMAVPAILQPTDGGYPLSYGMDLIERKTDSLSGSNVGGKTAGLRIWTIIWVAWLTGSCLLALWLLGVNGSFRRRVRRNRLPFTAPGNMQRQLPVYVTDEISTPCMFGLLRPAIYITPQAAEDSQVLATVLCHEYMHYRHGDHVWSAVRMLCLCIHWYNPLVWVAVGMSRQDGELACDEGVLRQLGEENRKCYGEALLALSTERRPSLHRSLNLATSMSDTRKQLKERLSALVTIPRMAAGTAVLVVLLSLGLAACTFTSRAEDREEDLRADRSEVWKRPEQTLPLSVRYMRYNASAGGTGGQDMGAADVGAGADSEQEMETMDLGQDGDIMSDSEPEVMKNEETASQELRELENTGSIYDSWNVETLEYYDEEGHPVAKVTEGDITRKLTFVETSWSVSAVTVQFSREVLYWACQALQELEQWTGTRVTEVCYTVSEFGDFSFGLTPGDMKHSRTFYSRCYSGLAFTRGEGIESIDYCTDMDVWYSPVKQYTTPPGYDKMTTEERLIWFFERSAIARGSKVVEVIYPWEGADYLLRTDQGTYYNFADTEGIDTLGKGLYLTGPYDGIPEH